MRRERVFACQYILVCGILKLESKPHLMLVESRWNALVCDAVYVCDVNPVETRRESVNFGFTIFTFVVCHWRKWGLRQRIPVFLFLQLYLPLPFPLSFPSSPPSYLSLLLTWKEKKKRQPSVCLCITSFSSFNRQWNAIVMCIGSKLIFWLHF